MLALALEREQVILPRLVSVKQTALALGVGETEVKRMIRLGQLVSVKLSSRRLIPVTAIDDLVQRLLED
jgi:hypothetical protein